MKRLKLFWFLIKQAFVFLFTSKLPKKLQEDVEGYVRWEASKKKAKLLLGMDSPSVALKLLKEMCEKEEIEFLENDFDEHNEADLWLKSGEAKEVDLSTLKELRNLDLEDGPTRRTVQNLVETDLKQKWQKVIKEPFGTRELVQNYVSATDKCIKSYDEREREGLIVENDRGSLPLEKPEFEMLVNEGFDDLAVALEKIVVEKKIG